MEPQPDLIDTYTKGHASHRKPVTGIPEINLEELDIGNKITLIKTPNGQPVSEYR